mmetsp:Transcript_129332/g.314216  ORF Transcript_129332/g.314216 Transcript_129332/m.314216 type:complete len:322 (-) Transcript_129332:36-1001(-)
MGCCRGACLYHHCLVALFSILPGFVLDGPVQSQHRLLPRRERDSWPPPDPGTPVPTLALCWVAAWDSGQLDNFTAANVRHFHKAYPQFMSNATLWVDEATKVPSDVREKVRIRILPRGYDGKIGKTYALRYSEPMDTSHVLFLDGDTWVCPGWIDFLYWHLVDTTVDVVWTITPIKCGRYVDFKCDVAMNPAIWNNSRELVHFKRFPERNSGTVFAVRRSERTMQWLTDAAELYPRMLEAGVVLGDQPALRESFFLHRDRLKEVIVHENHGCRANLWKLPLHLQWKGQCPCKCSCSSCLFIHNKQEFPECARDLGVWQPPH